MMSEGKQVGDWDDTAFSLTPVGNGAFKLEAENEELTFLPDSPTDFAAAGAGSSEAGTGTTGMALPGDGHVVKEGPPPQPLTLLLFYLLLAGTLAMAVWAAVSLF